MKTAEDRADIDRQVEETLAVFGRREELPPDPRFHEKVMTRLARGAEPRSAFAAGWRPALVALLAVMNMATAIHFFGYRSERAPGSQPTGLRQVLAADLNLGNEQEWPFETEQD